MADLMLDDLIAYVGAENFEAACRCAWDLGPEDWPEGLADVPHELSDLLWYPSSRGVIDDAQVEERLDLALLLYRRMPCYANLMYAISFVEGMASPDVRTRFWEAYRELLEQPDDRLAQPVAYTLDVDYFEGHELVGEIWREMTAWPEPRRRRRRVAERAALDRARRRLRRVLEVAAAVPWELKAPLLERLQPDVQWHAAMFRCLHASVFGVHGNVDRVAARDLLDRLRLPADTPDVGRLVNALAGE